ncbi:unnamed protein product [Urochloa humidicola]
MSGQQRHNSTLQQLLAWEKKLYKDVKAMERLQINHDKKLAELRNRSTAARSPSTSRSSSPQDWSSRPLRRQGHRAASQMGPYFSGEIRQGHRTSSATATEAGVAVTI